MDSVGIGVLTLAPATASGSVLSLFQPQFLRFKSDLEVTTFAVEDSVRTCQSLNSQAAPAPCVSMETNNPTVRENRVIQTYKRSKMEQCRNWDERDKTIWSLIWMCSPLVKVPSDDLNFHGKVFLYKFRRIDHFLYSIVPFEKPSIHLPQ